MYVLDDAKRLNTSLANFTRPVKGKVADPDAGLNVNLLLSFSMRVQCVLLLDPRRSRPTCINAYNASGFHVSFRKREIANLIECTNAH